MPYWAVLSGAALFLFELAAFETQQGEFYSDGFNDPIQGLVCYHVLMGPLLIIWRLTVTDVCLTPKTPVSYKGLKQ